MTDTTPAVAPHGLYTPEEIFRLLPAALRVRDVEQAGPDGTGPLHQLIEVICDEVNAIAEGIEQFYDDQFIETCADWVAPYIGDLIGYRTLHGVVPKVASPRAEVANTIRYRRRKGTASMLEQLARDVTGWPARAVEFFELLTTTQYMKHVRPQALGTTDLRDEPRLALGAPYQAGAFDSSSHTAEMRRIETAGGRYNISNVGIFLWRVGAQPIVRSPLVVAQQDDERHFRFDPLGADSNLYGNPRPEEEITHIAEPLDVPLPLTVRQFDSPGALTAHYGAGRSFFVESETAGSDPVPAPLVDICDLSDDPANPGKWNNDGPAADGAVRIDPHLGRVLYPAAVPTGTTPLGTFHRGSALEIGGGGYDRSATLDASTPVVTVSGGGSLTAALDQVQAGGAVEISDFRRYGVPATIKVAAPPDNGPVTSVRSANRTQPLLRRSGQVRLDMAPNTTIELDGLVLTEAPLVIDEVADAGVRHLIIRDCTLVPGSTRTPDGQAGAPERASLIVLHPFATVQIERSILGPIVAVEGVSVTITDSIIDASARERVAFCGRADPGGNTLRTVSSAADREVGDGDSAGGDLSLDSCTVIGRVHAERVEISNSIVLAEALTPTDPWPAPLRVERRQEGCVRFSFIPTPARVPRRFECVPHDGVDPRAEPRHTSLRFGAPAYGQLATSTDAVIRRGSDDESEMGVTRSLHQPQREANLRIRLDEYLRFGLEAGFIYAS